MPSYKAPTRDLQFLMFDVFNLENFWSQLNLPGEVDRAMAEAILEEAGKICEEVLFPLNREADEEGCSLENGEVKAPAGFKEAYETFCSGGWCGLGGNPEYDGMGMPKSLAAAVEEMVQGASMAWGLAPMLTAGACLALDAHGSDELKALYLPKMYSGQWSGAMDLTEPHAGTDLGLIRTKAEAMEDGSYAITGTKIFITWGEHDMAENIVHLVLAKLPDAPAGTKGISMFLVPKYLPDDSGNLGERNALQCGALEKKMGIKASATCVMNFDGAKGWLVGQANKGLACMFTMMNYERLVVGIQGIGAAEASYQNALEYAKERLQSRSPDGPKNPDKAADPIIVHPDIRRLLSTVKVYNEASRAFYLYVAQFLDLAKYSRNAEEKKSAENRMALLTPIAKAFITDLAFDNAVMAQQVLGGHGYIREWGLEQYVRDIRITQIYEGTNGIQAMDLMARKIAASNGSLWFEQADEIAGFLSKSKQCLDDQYVKSMDKHLELCASVTKNILEKAEQSPSILGAVACDYMQLVGHTLYAYMWLQMIAADSSDTSLLCAKKRSAEFYFNALLPKNLWLAEKIGQAQSVMALSDEDY